MGQKDITEKMLADYNDVFADIVNTLLFDGRQVIHEDDLVNVKDKSQYKAGTEIHEQERDVTKLFQKNRIQIAMIGMEDQTEVDPDEVFRVLGYESTFHSGYITIVKQARYLYKRFKSTFHSGYITIGACQTAAIRLCVSTFHSGYITMWQVPGFVLM